MGLKAKFKEQVDSIEAFKLDYDIMKYTDSKCRRGTR
jgi:hypothetical protein